MTGAGAGLEPEASYFVNKHSTNYVWAVFWEFIGMVLLNMCICHVILA